VPSLRLDQLEAHLARELRPLYAIHGDEPLLSLEAADAIRARARAGGFSERTVLSAERGFNWSELGASAAFLRASRVPTARGRSRRSARNSRPMRSPW
jgi:hypothetical protein